jgi:Raf kinase inhibitor-like YbhB/YbcL family protein
LESLPRRKSAMNRQKMLWTAALVFGWIVLLAHDPLQAEEKMPLSLKSTAFTQGGSIPVTHTCEGKDLAPALAWEGVPPGTRSLVLIADDPDAPDPRAPKMTWVHWVLFNLPPDSSGLPEGATSKHLPAGTGEGLNDWNRTGYGGPCPPVGRHRYFFKLYALDTVLKGLDRPTKAQVEAAIQGHIIVKTELVGTYQKKK